MLSLTIFTAFAFVLGSVSASVPPAPGQSLCDMWKTDKVCAAFYQFILGSQGMPGNVGYQQILVPYPLTIEASTNSDCADDIKMDFWYLHVPMMQYNCHSSNLTNNTGDDLCCNGTLRALMNTIWLRYWNVGLYGKQNCTANDTSTGCQWIYLDVVELLMEILNEYCFTSETDCHCLLNFKRKDFNVRGEMKIRKYARSKCFAADSPQCTNDSYSLAEKSWYTCPDRVRNSLDRLLQNCVGYNPDDPWCDCDSDCNTKNPVPYPGNQQCQCDTAGFEIGRDIADNVRDNRPMNFEGAALGYLTTMYESSRTPFCGKQRSDFMDAIIKECEEL